jgi:hypothetical protein
LGAKKDSAATRHTKAIVARGESRYFTVEDTDVGVCLICSRHYT